MAYDANDPADRKVVADAVAAREAELQEAHEAEITGLKDKNTELLGKLRKARSSEGGGDSAEVERLENELHDVQGKLRTAEANLRQSNRDLQARTAERDTATRDLETERTVARDTLVNSSLTTALVEANVQSQFLEDVTASLSRQVTVKEVDGKRQAFVGDKPLGEFVKEWSQGDKGKHYVGASANGGGGSTPPGNPQGGAKRISDMSQSERVAAYNANPADFDKRVAAGEDKPLPKS